MPLTTYTAGEVLTAASLNANLSFAASAGGLTFISSTTIGTTVSSVTVTGAFSATYENYLIVISGGVASAATPNLNLTLGATITTYAYGYLQIGYGAATVTGFNSNSATSFVNAARGSSNALDGDILIKNPFETKRTTVQYRSSTPLSNEVWTVGGGYLNNATSYTDFTITASSGTMTGGTVRVYGYTNS